jgi:hypothetical protein
MKPTMQVDEKRAIKAGGRRLLVDVVADGILGI